MFIGTGETKLVPTIEKRVIWSSPWVASTGRYTGNKDEVKRFGR